MKDSIQDPALVESPDEMNFADFIKEGGIDLDEVESLNSDEESEEENKQRKMSEKKLKNEIVGVEQLEGFLFKSS